MSDQPVQSESTSDQRAQHRHVVLKVVLATSVALAVITAVGVTWAYKHLAGNLTTEDFGAGILIERPEKVDVGGPHEQLNILVLGDDTRAGAGNSIDGEGGGGSDTTILIHLSADRKRAYGLSIPRDTLVDRPRCTGEDGDELPPARDAMWNAAYSVGGPSCTIAQLEQVTGIAVDHAVVVDFAGFRDMVDAVGGVDVCIPEDIDDREHGIFLKKGERRITGKEALSYVRVRHVGDGSDLGRIRRQQAFLASMSAEVLAADTFSSPPKLYRFLNAATKSVTLDEGIGSLRNLADLGYQFRGIGLNRIQFVTAPWQPAPDDPNRIRLLQPEAEAVFKRLRNDQALTRQQTSGSISAGQVPGSPSAGGTSSPTDEPSDRPSEEPSTGTSPAEPTDSPSIDEETERANEQAGLC